MVRLKSRYLLLHILYPSPSTPLPAAIPPTILFHQPSPPTLTPSLLSHHIRTSVSHLFGDHGLGSIASTLSIKYLSTATSTAIVKVARAHYRVVWAALTFLTGVGGRECVIRVVRVCGTVRGAEKEAVRWGKRVVGMVRGNGEEAGGGDAGGGDVFMRDSRGGDEDGDEREIEDEDQDQDQDDEEDEEEDDSDN